MVELILFIKEEKTWTICENSLLKVTQNLAQLTFIHTRMCEMAHKFSGFYLVFRFMYGRKTKFAKR